jgi:diguanylate cyclase (GGDEF)-like protein
MTIAMMATWLDGWYQTQLWRGAVAASRVHGSRLLCLVGNAKPSFPAPSGPEGICGLAARPEIDGVLLSAGPLSFWEGAAALDHIQSWLPSTRPVVCLGQDRENVPSIVPDGSGIWGLVQHLIQEHGCRHIAFLEGPPTNADSARRLSDFLAGCEQAGIESDPRLREVGHFNLEGGEAAMESILGRGVPFDAVVCANDAMAMGAVRVLERRGLRVPLDVRLVGYDDCEESRTHQPPLTTVRSPTYQIGFRGLEMCLERIEGKSENSRLEILPTTQVLRKSCGCLVSPHTMQKVPETAIVRGMPSVSRVVELMAASDPEPRQRFLRDFLGILRDSKEGELEVWQEILFSAARLALHDTSPESRTHVEETVLQAHVLLSEAREGTQSVQRLEIEGLVRQLHIAMNALLSDLSLPGFQIRLALALRTWCDEARIFLFRRDGSPEPDQNLSICAFQARWSMREGRASAIGAGEEILPPGNGEGEIWIGLPIEHAGSNFGVLLFRGWLQSESFIEHLRLVVSSFIHGIWRCEEDRRQREELHSLSVRDSLTGLLNRRGFMEVGERLATQAQRDGRQLGILMADLDGLKEINDSLGHAEGDLAIQAFAGALRDSFRASDTIARLGGDEFAVIFPIGQARLEGGLQERIRKALGRRNQELARSWTVGSSLGILVWDPIDGRSFSEALAVADAALYRDKRERKAC